MAKQKQISLLVYGECTPTVDQVATGQKAKAFRKSKRVQAVEVAKIMGLHKSQVSHLESGLTQQWGAELETKYTAAVLKVAETIK